MSTLQILGYEWIWVVLAIVVLLFGSKKLPEVARALGKAVAEFNKGRMEVERELMKAAREAEKQVGERERLEKAAIALGVETEGKSVEELREAIIRALRKDEVK